MERCTLTGEFPPGTEPRMVKMMAELLFFHLSLTRVIRLKQTNCTAISMASSQPMTEVKSQNHSPKDRVVHLEDLSQKGA